LSQAGLKTALAREVKQFALCNFSLKESPGSIAKNRPITLGKQLRYRQAIGNYGARAAVAALGDMVRMTGNNDTGEAGEGV
jgi:hypothetical protein